MDPSVSGDLTAVAPSTDAEYLYVADSTNDDIRVFDWPSRDRNTSRDIDVSGQTDFPNGVVSDGTHAWVYRDGDTVFAYLLSTGAYDSTHDITGPSGSRIRGGMYWDGVLWFANILSDTVVAYDADTLAALPNRNLALPAASSNAKGGFASAGIGWIGASSGADRIWYAFQLSDGSRLADRDITVDSALFGEGAFTDGTHGWALNGRAASAYLLADGVRDNGEDFNLPSSEFGSGRGATVVMVVQDIIVPTDVAGEATAGDPTVTGNLAAIAPATPTNVAGVATAGDPTVSGDVTALTVPPVDVAGTVTAGDPTVTGNVTAIAPGVVNLQGTATAGAPSVSGTLIPGAPGAPASLIVSDILSDSASVVWTAPTSDGGESITGYDLWYREVGTTPWTMVSLGVVLVDAISGLSETTQYQVRVRAVNSVGNGSWLSTTFTTTVFVAGWDIRRNGAELIGANVLPGVVASRGNAAGRTGVVPRAGHLAFVTDSERVELGDTIELISGSVVEWRGTARDPKQSLDTSLNALRWSVDAAGPIADIVAVESGAQTREYTNISPSDAIIHVLDAIDWPAARRDIGASSRRIAYWRLSPDKSPWQELLTLRRTAGARARLYEDRQGRIAFRDIPLPARSRTLYGHASGTGARPILTRMNNENEGLDRVVNQITLPYSITPEVSAIAIAPARWGTQDLSGIDAKAGILNLSVEASETAVAFVGLGAFVSGALTIPDPQLPSWSSLFGESWTTPHTATTPGSATVVVETQNSRVFVFGNGVTTGTNEPGQVVARQGLRPTQTY